MKKAILDYYNRLAKKYMAALGTLPSVTYDSKIEKRLIISEVDDDGDVEWRPFEVEHVDWNYISNVMQINICDELKAYYSSFYHMGIAGIYNTYHIYLYANSGAVSVEKKIIQEFNDGQYFFPTKQWFLIGTATYKGDDNYFVFYDNLEGLVYVYETDQREVFLLCNSLINLISSLEASI